MKKLARRFFVVLLLAISAFAYGDGGGGMFIGYQMARYPLLDDYPIASNGLGLGYYGAYGYDVSSGMSKIFTGSTYKRSPYLNTIAGGFGYAIMDVDNPQAIAGGFGGVVSGIRIIKLPISVSIVSYTGFGGIGRGKAYVSDGPRGFFCVSEEVTLEVGIPLIEWFMPTAYVGYQVIGNVIPGRLFDSFLSYTPVAGVRVQFGDFH